MSGNVCAFCRGSVTTRKRPLLQCGSCNSWFHGQCFQPPLTAGQIEDVRLKKLTWQCLSCQNATMNPDIHPSQDVKNLLSSSMSSINGTDLSLASIVNVINKLESQLTAVKSENTKLWENISKFCAMKSDIDTLKAQNVQVWEVSAEHRALKTDVEMLKAENAQLREEISQLNVVQKKTDANVDALTMKLSHLRDEISQYRGLRADLRALDFRMETMTSWSMTPGRPSLANLSVGVPGSALFSAPRRSGFSCAEDEVGDPPSSPERSRSPAPSLTGSVECIDDIEMPEDMNLMGSQYQGPPGALTTAVGTLANGGGETVNLAGGPPVKRRPLLSGNAPLSSGAAMLLQSGSTNRDLFVTRLHPELTSDQLKSYMAEKLSSKRKPVCTRIRKTGLHSSFRVKLMEHEFVEANSASFWPSGICCREYFFRRGRQWGPRDSRQRREWPLLMAGQE